MPAWRTLIQSIIARVMLLPIFLSLLGGPAWGHLGLDLSLDLGSGTASGQAFYVASTGSDTAPYDTPAKAATAFATIAALDPDPGATIWVASDISVTDIYLGAGFVGEVGKPITIRSYGGRRTITCGGAVGIGVSAGRHHIVFRDLDFVGTVTNANVRYGIGTADLIVGGVYNCTFSAASPSLLEFENADSTHTYTLSNILVYGCTFTDPTKTAESIYINTQSYLEDVHVAYNQFENTKRALIITGAMADLDTVGRPPGVYIGHNTIADTGDAWVTINTGAIDPIIEYNDATDACEATATTCNGYQLNWVSGLEFRYNSSDGIRAADCDAALLIGDYGWSDTGHLSTAWNVHHNEFHDALNYAENGCNGRAIELWMITNSDFHTNLITTSDRGFRIANAQSSGNSIINNTIVDCWTGVRIIDSAPEVALINNLIIDSTAYGIQESGATDPATSHNCVWGSGMVNFDGFTADATDIQVDPQEDGSYIPQAAQVACSGSVAAAVLAVVDDDYYGTAYTVVDGSMAIGAADNVALCPYVPPAGNYLVGSDSEYIFDSLGEYIEVAE